MLAAAAAASRASGSGLSGSAMAQLVQNASAAKFSGLTASGNSMNNLLLHSGLSRDQLSQLANEGASTMSLSNMMQRQSSFDALMSLDLQSIQSIDNLANLIQTGAQGSGGDADMRNWSADVGAAVNASNSGNNLSSLASAKRMASANHLESLIRSLSSQNVNKTADANVAGGSNANFSNILQSMQSYPGNLGATDHNVGGLFGSGMSRLFELCSFNMYRFIDFH